MLWTSDEFGFARLDDAYATGSSMLPQKKNPDIAELARGKAGRLIGNLTGLLATLKGLPLAYNRDLQEDKEALFDSVEQVDARRARRSPGWSRRRPSCRNGCAPPRTAETMAATDLAEWLVVQGTPFRDAHAIVGTLVRRTLAGEARWPTSSPPIRGSVPTPLRWSLPVSGVPAARRPAGPGPGR